MAARDKVLERAELARRLPGMRGGGRKVVFTNGVFDLLHVGHVRYLEFARAQGDMLIVGVNSDASARALDKGAARPLVGAAARAEVVAALETVDYVCIFDESLPNETIAALRPDVHVKGAGYELEQLPEAPVVRSYGGEVVLAPHIEGFSSTSIIERAKGGPA